LKFAICILKFEMAKLWSFFWITRTSRVMTVLWRRVMTVLWRRVMTVLWRRVMTVLWRRVMTLCAG
jgi:hypothetical protein